VCAALHYVVHLERTAAGQHRVAAIGRFRLRGGVLDIAEVH
jgi:hypothetical protein